MSYLNNANPRRMVWFSQNAPQSKTDLWLSYNLHYEDIGDEVTNDEPGTVIDNPNQRNCDLVLKAWDCGQWVPIVGYNTTSVNKINTVKNAEPYVLIDRHGEQYTSSSGITEGHLPLFRKPADSPSELFDGGSVGDVLLHFVNKNDWTQIINNGGLGVAISSGVTIDIRRANATELGGIWARPFSTVNASGEYAEVKFKTSQAGTDDKLYVYGGDIVGAINGYTAGSGSGSVNLNIHVATVDRIGGINSQVDTYAEDHIGLPVVFGGPNCGLTYGLPDKPQDVTIYGDSLTYNPNNTFLYVPDWALSGWLKKSMDDNTGVNGYKGVDVSLRTGYEGVWTSLSGYDAAKEGQYLTKGASGSVVWVDAPSGGNYQVLASGSSEQYHYVVKGGSDNKHFLNGDGEWAVPEASGTTYTNGAGLYLVSNEFGIDASGVASGYVLGANGLNGVEWVPMASGSTIDIIMNNVNASGEDLWIVSDEIINNDGLLDKTEEWNAYNITNFKSFNGFGTLGDHNNPIYIKMDVASGMPVVASGTTLNVIDSNNCISGNAFSSAGTHLFTIQFGTLKVEKVTSIQGYSQNAENN